MMFSASDSKLLPLKVLFLPMLLHVAAKQSQTEIFSVRLPVLEKKITSLKS